jgi:hypothetical protein
MGSSGSSPSTFVGSSFDGARIIIPATKRGNVINTRRNIRPTP